MVTIKGLNFVAMPKNSGGNIAAHRRNKLLLQLEQQRALALDPLYVHPRQRWVKAEDGTKQLISAPKRVKRWWFADAAGVHFFIVRYGSKRLEFEKGKSAINVGDKSKLVTVIEAVIAAVKAGEFDALLSAVERVGQRPTRKAA